MMFQFNHFNFNILDLERSLKFYEEALDLKPVREKNASDGSILHLQYRIWKRHTHGTRKWDASALKTPPWVFILSRIPMDTGSRSYRKNGKETEL